MQTPLKIIKIAVVGLANVGKTTFINSLTGSNLKTANFAGSTTGNNEIAMLHNGYTIIFFDLPGFTSFESPENDLEKKAVNFLKNAQYDAILHITNSEFSYFSSILDVSLRKSLQEKPILTAINCPSLKNNPKEVAKAFEKSIIFSALSRKNVFEILNSIIDFTLNKEAKNQDILDYSKLRWDTTKITKNIDKIATSKIFGMPLFFVIMFTIFWLSFVIGKSVGDYLLTGFDALVEISANLSMLSSFLKALIKSVLIGVGTVVGFMPIIIICVTLIGLMEQTGYITRVSFLLDKFFEKFNLGGKSVIPLIIGAGCSITAYMSTRMISDPKEKFLTMVIIGFVPCTAKLAVFMLFCAALFGENAPIAISIIYFSGFIVGLIVAKLIGIFIKSEKHQKTKIELYNYRLPQMRNILKSGYSRTMDYIKNAATFITIFASGLAILSLTGYENGSFIVLAEEEISRSFIGIVGQFLTPVFAPLDFDYRMIISLITGLVAKEVAISTLASLYAISTDQLINVVSNVIGFRQAVTYIVFMFFYLPCVSATASFYREANSFKKTLFLIILTTFFAYFFSWIANITIKTMF